jgi:sulfur relay (sulfurtransferase) DsrC/TusE family protein
MAKRDGLAPLSRVHWKVIDFIRRYFRETARGAPAVRIGRALGLGAGELRTLFPGGIAREAYRMAGLPRLPGGM